MCIVRVKEIHKGIGRRERGGRGEGEGRERGQRGRGERGEEGEGWKRVGKDT